MIKKIKIKDWYLTIDPEETSRILRNIKSDGETCSCLYCRNFVAARDKIFSEEFLCIMKETGIDPKKDMHTCHIVELDGGLHLYQIDYYFTGDIISGPSVNKPVNSGSFNITGNVSYRKNEFPSPALVLECYLHIPWVLNEKPY
jgi:hypothetical protein